MRRMMILVTALGAVAAGCVWPIPAPSAPIPSIDATLTYSAADRTLHVEATPINIVPTGATVWPDGFGGPVEPLDIAPPWEFTIDRSGAEIGNHEAKVMFTDGTTHVTLPFGYEVVGCNGLIDLCDRSYDDLAYATTHNAMSSAADGWLGPNQEWDVPTQLESGVRALMLDTYRAGDLNSLGNPEVPGVDPDTGYLCHALCLLGSQPLAEGLGEIADFLDANPGEVLTVIIETYLSSELTDVAFVASGLDDQAYVHPTGTPWPTLGQLIDADTRLVVMQDRAVDPNYPYLLNVWGESFETGFDNSVPADFTCHPNRGSPSNDLFIVNHFLTQVFGGRDLAEQVNYNPLLIDRMTECAAFNDTAVNFVTVDFVDIGDTLVAVDLLNQVTNSSANAS